MRYFDLPCSSSGGGVGPGNETRWFFPTTGEGHISDIKQQYQPITIKW